MVRNLSDHEADTTFLSRRADREIGQQGIDELTKRSSTAQSFLPSNKTLLRGKENGNRGFLLPLVILQQLMGGMAGYFRLVKVASLLNLSIVEPYYQETGLTGAPLVSKVHPVLQLGSMYDLKEIKSVLKKQIPNSDLVTFKYFFERTSRRVLFLTFSTSQHKHFGNRNVFSYKCSNKEAKAAKRLNEWSYHVLQEHSQFLPFYCSRAVMVDARPKHPMTLSAITEGLGSIIEKHAKEYGTVTVIVKTWRSIHRHSDTNYFYVISDWKDIKINDLYSIKHSEIVINASLEFTQTMSSARPVIGVHIRAERVLNAGRNITHCLGELSNLLRNGSIVNATDGKVHLFHDLGRYGTMGCGNGCNKKYIISEIRQLGFPIVHYDPTNFKSFPTHRAFVAFVEQEYLSRVDVLVTVGFGGFQKSIVKTFLKYNGGNSENLHRLCSFS